MCQGQTLTDRESEMALVEFGFVNLGSDKESDSPENPSSQRLGICIYTDLMAKCVSVAP